jgi:hypothetical protein
MKLEITAIQYARKAAAQAQDVLHVRGYARLIVSLLYLHLSNRQRLNDFFFKPESLD